MKIRKGFVSNSSSSSFIIMSKKPLTKELVAEKLEKARYNKICSIELYYDKSKQSKKDLIDEFISNITVELHGDLRDAVDVEFEDNEYFKYIIDAKIVAEWIVNAAYDKSQLNICTSELVYKIENLPDLFEYHSDKSSVITFIKILLFLTPKRYRKEAIFYTKYFIIANILHNISNELFALHIKQKNSNANFSNIVSSIIKNYQNILDILNKFSIENRYGAEYFKNLYEIVNEFIMNPESWVSQPTAARKKIEEFIIVNLWAEAKNTDFLEIDLIPLKQLLKSILTEMQAHSTRYIKFIKLKVLPKIERTFGQNQELNEFFNLIIDFLITVNEYQYTYELTVSDEDGDAISSTLYQWSEIINCLNDESVIKVVQY